MHEGHRQRMYEKLQSGDALCDHEVLETFLFGVVPRQNTNPVAHALINAFGTLAGVFEASVESLMAVEGVGKNVALYIKCAQAVFERINPVNAGVAVLKTYEDFKNFATVRMRGRKEEVLELYCIEKGGKVKKIIPFTDFESSKVEVETSTLLRLIAAEKPYGLLAAHNHLSGSSAPSENDDRFTVELQLICNMAKVIFYDHCVYSSDNDVYSYFSAGKIDTVKRNFGFKSVIDNQLKACAAELENKNGYKKP